MIPRLLRPRTDRMIGGVCGGLGLYFGLDPVIIRLLFVVLAFTTGLTLILYPILWVIMPSAPDGQSVFLDSQLYPGSSHGVPQEPAATAQTVHLYTNKETLTASPGTRKRVLALVLLGVGGLILLENLGEIFGVDLSGIVVPLLLVSLGIYLLRGARSP